MLKQIHIYDCDGVLVDSSHRYRNLPNGSIDLDYWFANQTIEKVDQDTLLPLANNYKKDLADPETYVVIATARFCNGIDFHYFRNRLGWPDKLICRHNDKPVPDSVMKVNALKKLFALKQFANLRKRFWDDNIKNIYAVSELGVQCFFIQSENGK